MEKRAKGVCVEKKRSSALFKIESVQEVSRELPYLLSVNIVFPKGKHLEDMVDGLTQLGVSRIVPVISDRASWKVDATRIKRLKRTVAESCKQCGRNILPKITEPVSLQESLEMAKGVKLFFDTGATETMAQASLNITPGSDVNGWIGPEGGWSDRELELFNGDEDAKMLSLSPAVLRTETAALSFVSQLFARSGEKG